MGMIKTIGYITCGAVVGATVSIIIDKKEHYIKIVNGIVENSSVNFNSRVERKRDYVCDKFDKLEKIINKHRESF